MYLLDLDNTRNLQEILWADSEIRHNRATA